VEKNQWSAGVSPASFFKIYVASLRGKATKRAGRPRSIGATRRAKRLRSIRATRRAGRLRSIHMKQPGFRAQKSIADAAMPTKNKVARNPFTSTSAKRRPWRL
jgi:hypothetical protein